MVTGAEGITGRGTCECFNDAGADLRHTGSVLPCFPALLPLRSRISLRIITKTLKTTGCLFQPVKPNRQDG